jgi:hypothetical protein
MNRRIGRQMRSNAVFGGGPLLFLLSLILAERQSSATSPPWTQFTTPPSWFLDTCLLLTTGDVMCHQSASNAWHRLRPDAFGNYQNGTWDSTPIPTMPNGNDSSFGCSNCVYAPVFFGSAVLSDGRVVVIGGEDNGLTGNVDTNIGFIYDPVANTWGSQLTSAFTGGNVGDTMSMVLQDGTFVDTDIHTKDMQALNATTGVFTAKNSTGKLDNNDEENWNILYDGTVLTVDSTTVSSFERYTESTNTWGNSGSTQVNMADFGTGTGNSDEVGPCALRPDNKLMCFSGNPNGQNALYDPSSNTWLHTTAMDFPVATGGGHFAMADGPAAALPNGNILVMASPVTTTKTDSTPSHFYELSTSNSLAAVTDSPNAASFDSYQGRMLMLPTGQVLLTAYNQGSIQDVLLYSNGGAPVSSGRPVITSAPSTIAAGGVYSISGTLFNGFSMGATYGDDAQSATNYPLVRITNYATGHVYYARTFNHSRMGVEPTGSTTSVTTTFQVPTNFENGEATIQVVANGIASVPVNVSTKFNALTPINGWAGSPFGTETPAYSNVDGIVQLKGAMQTNGTDPLAFTMPAGSIPSSTVYVQTDLYLAATGRLTIDTAGNVTAQDDGGGFVNAPQFTSLEGVSFAVNATGFTALTLQNGWTNAPFGTRNAAVKNDNGVIRFEGAIATSGTNPVPFTLPAGFIPPTALYVPIGLCDAASGRLFIQTTGVVTVETQNSFSDAQCFTSLEGATFALSSSGYTAPTLVNGWVNAPYGTRSVMYKNDDGILRLQGAVADGTDGVLFTLPPALWPSHIVYVNIDLCNAAQGRVFAQTDGAVIVQAQNSFSDAQCFSSLEGVSFGFGQ